MDKAEMMGKPLSKFLKQNTSTLTVWANKWWPMVEQEMDSIHASYSDDEEDEMNIIVSQTLTASHGGTSPPHVLSSSG